MTIKELMEELREYPEDTCVVVRDNSGVNGWFDYESAMETSPINVKEVSVRGVSVSDDHKYITIV